jgi:glycosyltransferase involved in cell wall biosynthesis
LPGAVRQRSINRDYSAIPELNQKSHAGWELVSRLGRKIKPAGLTSSVNWYDVLFYGHDLRVSKTLEPALDAVYAYEDAAKQTFAAARRRRIAAIYELPLGYYQGVAAELDRAQKERAELSPVFDGEPAWKQARKDAELELADMVIVACQWAAQSLRHSKAFERKRTITVPYGTPAADVTTRTARPAGEFTVLFAGHIGLRKGVPHLLDAWERLGLKEARLLLAGPMHLSRDYLDRHSSSFEHLGAVPRVRLFELMKEADLFVFPSLAEGFGLVIGEAMSCGVPVLTTTNTGGPELITDGREGWCVPAHDAGALAERIEWAYSNRDELYEMGRRARSRAEQWTWADYRRKLARELSAHLG